MIKAYKNKKGVTSNEKAMCDETRNIIVDIRGLETW